MEFWYSLFSFFLFFFCLEAIILVFFFACQTTKICLPLRLDIMCILEFTQCQYAFFLRTCKVLMRLNVFFFFAFAFNAKSFAIGILTFCSFFLSSKFFWTDCQKLFSQHFNFSCQENVWSRFELFLGYTKLYFRKNCSWSCYSRGVWHITRLICTVTSTCNVQKSTRNCQNWPSKHQRKNIIQTASRWQKI